MSAATPLPDDLAESLEAALDEALPGLPRDEHDRPYLPDDDAADWALRKLAKHRARAAEVTRMANERIAAITAWHSAQQDSIGHDAAFFEGLLEGYHRRVMDEQAAPWAKKERKTITLPSGQLKATAGKPKVVYDDEGALAEWLRDARPELVAEEVIYKVSKTDVRKAFRQGDDGRLVDAADPDCPHCKGTGWVDGDDPDSTLGCPVGCAAATGEPVPGVHVETPGPTYKALT